LAVTKWRDVWKFRAQKPSADFAHTSDVSHTFKESSALLVKTGLGEFPSESGTRVDAPRLTARELRDHDGERSLEKDTVDRELMHRLHGDMRKALEEMRQTQAVTLTALSSLQATLIRWIIFTGLVITIVLKLF
jgi:hypothetical protein